MLGHALRENVAKTRAAALAFMELVGKQRLAYGALVPERGEARADLRALVKWRFAVRERFFTIGTHAAHADFSTEGAVRREEQGGQ